jgi:hypothetical protein
MACQLLNSHHRKPINFFNIKKQYDELPVVSTQVKTAVHELGTEEKRLGWRGK